METLETNIMDIPVTYLKGYNASNFFGLTVNNDIGQLWKKGTNLLIRKTDQVNQGDYVVLDGGEAEPFAIRRIYFESKDVDCYFLSDPQMCVPDTFIDKHRFENLLLGTVFLSLTYFGGTAQ